MRTILLILFTSLIIGCVGGDDARMGPDAAPVDVHNAALRLCRTEVSEVCFAVGAECPSELLDACVERVEPQLAAAVAYCP